MSIHIIGFITICSCNGSSYNIDASPLSDIWFSKLFSNFVGCQQLLFFDDVQHNHFFSYHSLVFQCNCLLFNVKIMVVLMVKNLSANAGDTTDSDLILVRKIPWRRKGSPPHHHLVFLPGKFHGQRSLVDYSPWVVHDWAHTHACLKDFSSVQWLIRLLRPHGLQHTRPPCPSSTPRAYSNSSLSHQWCHPTFPASGSFQMSQFFASGGQSIRVSASTSVLPMNIWTNFL